MQETIRFVRRRLWRDRRRYALIAVMLFAAGVLQVAGRMGPIYGVPAPWIGGFAYLLGIGIFAPIVSLAFPGARAALETAALTLLLWTFLGRFVPEANLSGLIASSPLWTPIVFVLAGQIVHRLVYGPWLDRWLRLASRPATGKARSNLSQARLWPGLVLDPQRPHLYYDPDDQAKAERLADGEPHMRLTWKDESGEALEERHEYTIYDPPFEARFLWEMPGSEATGARGIKHIRIMDHGAFREITDSFEVADRPLSAALFIWVDDGVGRLLEDKLAALEATARPGLGSPVSA